MLVKDLNKKLESLLKDAMWIIHETLTVFPEEILQGCVREIQ